MSKMFLFYLFFLIIYLLQYRLYKIASRKKYIWGCYGGALVFLGGAEAPASPSLAPPLYIYIYIYITVITILVGDLVPKISVGK